MAFTLLEKCDSTSLNLSRFSEEKITVLLEIFCETRAFQERVEPIVATRSDDAEVELALRVLEGCFLLHPQSTALAHQHNAIQVLMNILSTRGVLEQGACLDALISLIVDSSSNQMGWGRCSQPWAVLPWTTESYLLHITLICFMILILFSIYKLLHL
ncbi:hypothetical protein JHK82_052627 [Glycine max]|uniref:Uncharacterized protein n=1 Tax=Glycine soja TaxID=3848 RepID=A0A445FCQ7_GLYSO|nr:hypothetical protein JHK86_052474 [Glycine max]KAG4926838.1 hypothetical protein JHK85_053324 [Glycine max]KAG5082475.1 hypothetical protein JHK84_052513 [Glycine max]KAG5085230.1 hypothetical protein JHK82_052627 [Glycine max]RZB46614.1 hypothetical protein D0Y65_050584 [Glycine soja]